MSKHRSKASLLLATSRVKPFQVPPPDYIKLTVRSDCRHMFTLPPKKAHPADWLDVRTPAGYSYSMWVKSPGEDEWRQQSGTVTEGSIAA